MTDKEILTALDLEDGEVVRKRETPDGLVVLVDRGIKGTPKYLVPGTQTTKPADKTKAPVTPEPTKGAK